MQESSSNRHRKWVKHEIFSRACIPPETLFFVRLDGWKFKQLSEELKAEKPFDEKFVRCLVSSGKALFKKGLKPALIYIASDELNVLFFDTIPFNKRVEKLDSVPASLVSSAFTLCLLKFFKKKAVASFDSRVVTLSSSERIIKYLAWRQMIAWRNHNNAYAYWFLRKMGHTPSQISRKLKGLKTAELHETMFKQGVNLTQTPQWQRRGVLLYRQPLYKETTRGSAMRLKIAENWSLPMFTSNEGAKLIKQILKWTRQKRKK